MRVTNGTILRTFLNNLHNNLENMSSAENQMSNGQRINKPSDNPQGAVKIMELTDSINRNDQYLQNIEDSSNIMDTEDTALGQMGDALQRIRQLLTAASNGTNSQQERDAYSAEILQKIEEVAQSGNTSIDDRYIFGGNCTSSPPFEAKVSDTNDILKYNGDVGKMKREISSGVSIDINVTGWDIMHGNATNSVDLNATLKGIRDALKSGDTSKLSTDLLDDVSKNINNILNLRAEIGAKENRMESASNKNGQETQNLTAVLSKTADIDVAESIMHFKEMESVYQASLMTGAKVLQPSLIDFLR